MQYGQQEEILDWMRNQPMNFFEGQLSMDLNILMFITNQAKMATTQGLK